jgi:hypothetical protein
MAIAGPQFTRSFGGSDWEAMPSSNVQAAESTSTGLPLEEDLSGVGWVQTEEKTTASVCRRTLLRQQVEIGTLHQGPLVRCSARVRVHDGSTKLQTKELLPLIHLRAGRE